MSETFSAKSFIAHKRDGHTHSATELKLWLDKFLAQEVTDYQMAAWLMAVYFKGMEGQELSTWTELMMKSGTHFARESGDGYFVDKHSTGGVGDKPSVILVPLVASIAARLWGKGKLRIPMMSGRGLGHSGGTLDKLDAIPGFITRLNYADAMKIFRDHDFVMMGQTADLVPADRRIYSLRDVTATVESLPLIVSSILSKKLAESLNGLVLDVKFGPGAFMKTEAQARELAKKLVEVAGLRGVETVAWLTRMSEPLGYAVGNALEIQECIDYLTGERREKGLTEVTNVLAATMLELGSNEELDFAAALAEVETELKGDSPYRYFEKMVTAQGGRLAEFQAEHARFRDEYETLEFKASAAGFVKEVRASRLGPLSLLLGAGRESQDAQIDPWAGIRLEKKVGDKVTKGEVLCRLFYKRRLDTTALQAQLSESFEISDAAVTPPAWCVERIG